VRSLTLAGIQRASTDDSDHELLTADVCLGIEVGAVTGEDTQIGYCTNCILGPGCDILGILIRQSGLSIAGSVNTQQVANEDGNLLCNCRFGK